MVDLAVERLHGFGETIMDNDEKFRPRKDTLCEIHETGTLVGCLGRKFETQMESIEAVHNA